MLCLQKYISILFADDANLFSSEKEIEALETNINKEIITYLCVAQSE